MTSPAIRVVALVVVVALAGCPAIDQVGDGTTPTHTVSDGRVATVTDVVDGDTIDVRFADGSTDTVRLLGVDVPETRATNQPGEFEGVPDTDAGRACLQAAGEAASADVAARLDGREVRVATDPLADRRGAYDRLLAYVRVPNGSLEGDAGSLDGDAGTLNEWLVASGRARLYDTRFAKSAAFADAEAAARRDGLGLWQCRDGSRTTATLSMGESDSLVLAAIHEDAAGPDGDNLTDEYLVFANAGREPLDLGGWTVVDEAGKTYTVPTGTVLEPDARLRLVTGGGTDGNGTLYWGATGPVWNNDGDVVRVRDEGGGLVLEEGY